MDNKRILDKLDKLESVHERMDERIDNIDKSLAVYNEQLKVHIEGTVQNRKQIAALDQKILDKVTPIEDHVKSVNAILKFAGGIALLLAAFESIKNLLS